MQHPRIKIQKLGNVVFEIAFPLLNNVQLKFRKQVDSLQINTSIAPDTNRSVLSIAGM
jgi:hypothetical protein